MDPRWYPLILFVALLVLWGVLNAAFRRHRQEDCPRCGGPIERIHRSKLEKALGLILVYPTGKYQCDQCGWVGLRRRTHRRSSHSSRS